MPLAPLVLQWVRRARVGFHNVFGSRAWRDDREVALLQYLEEVVCESGKVCRTVCMVLLISR